MADLGVYIHYPWCRKLCPYCDFPVAIARAGEIPHGDYLRVVLDELGERAPAFAGRRLVSIYFGGGTPSLWPVRCLERVVDAVVSSFGARTAADPEITIEANPTDCTADILAAWQAAGINRVSIGVQSFDAGALAVLGRDHTQGDGAAALVAARAAGFDQVCADIIIGAPLANATTTVPSVIAAADAVPDHISVYELTIEDRTRFGSRVRRGDLVPLGDDMLAAKYMAAHEALTARGYVHYEVSNYARPGKRAVHNSLYWRGADYLGLGCGAASLLVHADGSGERWTNVRAARQYLRNPADDRVAERDQRSALDLADERLWLGMRTADGVAAADLADRPGAVESMLAHGFAERRDGRIRPTIRGFLYANQVARVIVGAERYN